MALFVTFSKAPLRLWVTSRWPRNHRLPCSLHF